MLGGLGGERPQLLASQQWDVSTGKVRGVCVCGGGGGGGERLASATRSECRE